MRDEHIESFIRKTPLPGLEPRAAKLHYKMMEGATNSDRKYDEECDFGLSYRMLGINPSLYLFI